MKRTENLDQFLEESDFDAFLMRASSEDADMYYLTQFSGSDPFIFLRKDKESTIIVPDLEHTRAKEEAEVDRVVSVSEFDVGKSDTDDLLRQIVSQFDIDRLAVPEDFPLKNADKLRESIELQPIENMAMRGRRQKTAEEIEKLRKAQDITEEAMRKAEETVRSADVKNGELFLEGEPLTSERLRREIRRSLLENDCATPHGTIAACGKDSAKPHSTGSGVLKADEPIIIDIFPRHENRYFGDMTRTFVKGDAPEEVEQMHKAVLEAQEAAFEILEQGAGVKACEVHDTVCEVLENHGYRTLRQGKTDSGFIHATGHGVGLELHEPPRIAENKDELEEGMILTIEPGLYIPEVGGVRIEDMIIVKEDGYENLNSMHKQL